MADTVNVQLEDLLVDNRSQLTVLEGSFESDIAQFFGQHRNNVIRAVERGATNTQIQGIIQRDFKKLHSTLRPNLQTLAVQEGRFLEGSLDKTIGRWYKVQPTSSSKLRSLVDTAPVYKGKNLERTLQGLAKGQETRIINSIKRVRAEGGDVNAIVSEMRRESNVTQNYANTQAHTAITSTSNAAYDTVIDENSTVVGKYRYSAVLDSRTSRICSHYSGKTYEYSDPNKILPPLHPNCRSLAVPLVKDINDINEDGTGIKKRDLASLGAEERALIDGKPGDDADYSGWLLRQPYEVQLRHLGDSSRVELFRSGDLTLDKFSKPDGAKVTLASLQKRQLDATKNISPSMNALTRYDGKSLNDANKFDIRGVTTPDELIQPDNLRQLGAFTVHQAQRGNLSLLDYKGANQSSLRKFRDLSSTLNADDWYENGAGQLTNKYRSVQSRAILEREKRRILDNPEIPEDIKQGILKYANNVEGYAPDNQVAATLLSLDDILRTYYRNPEPWDNFNAVMVSSLNRSNVGGIDRIARDVLRESNRQVRLDLNLAQKKFTSGVLNDDLSFEDVPRGVFDRRKVERIRKDRLAIRDAARDWEPNVDSVLAANRDFKGLRKTDRGEIRSVVWQDKRTNKSYTLREDAFGNILPEDLEKLPIAVRDRFIKTGFISNPNNKLKSKITPSDIELAIKEVVNGDLNDYDQIAVSIGRTLYSRHADELFGTPSQIRQFFTGVEQFKGTPAQWRRAGDEVLKSLQKNGHLRVRAVNREAPLATTLDGIKLDDIGGMRTYRAREIEWQGDFLTQKERNARVKIIENLGIIDSADEIVAVAKQPYYFDKSTARKIKFGLLKVDDLGRVAKETKVNVRRYTAKGKTYDVRVDKFGVPNRADLDRVPISARLGTYKRIKDGGTITEYVPVHTGIRVHTSGIVKGADRRVVNSLNAKQAIAREVDQDFFNAFEKIAVADVDGNSLRHVILERGNINQFQAARLHHQRNRPFRNFYQSQDSGRELGRGFLSPHSGEFWRPVLSNPKKVRLGESGWSELRQNLAVVINDNDKTKVNTITKRLAQFDQHLAAIDELGSIINQIGRADRPGPLIKKLYSGRGKGPALLTELDDELHPVLFRLAAEVNLIGDATGARGFKRFANLGEIHRWETKLMIEIDASESGSGLIGAVTRSRDTMTKTNLLPVSDKNRLREVIASEIVRDPKFQRLNINLTETEIAKVAKDSVTTAAYGSGRSPRMRRALYTQDKGIVDILSKKEGYTVISGVERDKILRNIDRVINNTTDVDDLRLLKNLRKETLVSLQDGTPLQWENFTITGDLHPDVTDVLRRMSNNNYKIVTPDDMSKIARMIQDKLAAQLPTQENYITFMSDVAERYLIANPDRSDIPFKAWDGAEFTHDYSQKIRYRFTDVDEFGVSRDVEVITTNPGKADIGKAKTAYGVKANFGQDSGITRRSKTAAIYDGFFGSAGDVAKNRQNLRKAYADVVESDAIMKNLRHLRRNGLPYKDYVELVREAKRLGLVDTPDAVTAADVLNTPPGTSWYGVDY